jgi:hypothetical protein
VIIDGVTQIVHGSPPSFNAYFPSNDCRSGMMFWTETFKVPAGKILEIYGATMFIPNTGINVTNFNQVSLGVGSLVVSE